ncbi:anti-sigma-K factor RskA [Catenuloplanes nepalensis]|uniref:Anti-sigma-K factor RskA n=1 Tax=Catenuloplanes nepalensis TaxID=587533 RepID=A0ABT9MXX7_9ACTN|nr:zf-HC2 domain-containing protein [Catenuloplanes nepalensis]MDP9796096.1 anti-sigma-K factor RskA [Catenuloplanes nepalensis]
MSASTCDDGTARSLVGFLVLGRLTEAEHGRVTAHLETCASCRAERDQLEKVVAVLRMLGEDEVHALVDEFGLDGDGTAADDQLFGAPGAPRPFLPSSLLPVSAIPISGIPISGIPVSGIPISPAEPPPFPARAVVRPPAESQALRAVARPPAEPQPPRAALRGPGDSQALRGPADSQAALWAPADWRASRGPADSQAVRGPVDSQAALWGPADSQALRGPAESQAVRGPVDSQAALWGPADSQALRGPAESQAARRPTDSQAARRPTDSQAVRAVAGDAGESQASRVDPAASQASRLEAAVRPATGELRPVARIGPAPSIDRAQLRMAEGYLPPRPATGPLARGPHSHRRQRSRRRTRVLVVAGVLVAAVGTSLLVRPLLTEEPPPVVAVASIDDEASGVAVSALLYEEDGRVSVRLTADGLTPGTAYQLFVVQDDGTDLLLGALSGDPGGGTFSGDVPLPVDALWYFSVREVDGALTVSANVVEGSPAPGESDAGTP